MSVAESGVESAVTEHAKRLGWRPRKVSFIGRRGCPDRWFFRAPGQLQIVEFKQINGTVSPHQRRTIRWLRDSGFNVAVIDNVQDGIELFDAWGAPGEDA